MITRKEFETISYHLLTDIDYGEGGTFNKEDKRHEGNYPFDKIEAKKVKRILLKLKDCIK
jgi:hypothetical protein